MYGLFALRELLRQLAAIYIMISAHLLVASVVALACNELLDVLLPTGSDKAHFLGLLDPNIPHWLGVTFITWVTSSCLLLVTLDRLLGLTAKELTMGKHVADTVVAFICLALLWIPIHNLWFTESPRGTRGDAFQWTSYVLLLLFAGLCVVFTTKSVAGWRDWRKHERGAGPTRSPKPEQGSDKDEVRSISSDEAPHA